mgnify:CR=1 FL=1
MAEESIKENINNKALKAGSWYIISNLILKGIAVITTPIFTRLLTPSEFGIVNTYISWMGILTVVGTLDLYASIQLARHHFEESQIDAFISSILSLSSSFLIGIYIIVKLLGTTAISFIEIPAKLIDIMFLEVLFANAFTMLQAKHRAFFRYKKFVLLTGIIAVLSPVLSIILVSLQDSELYYWKIVGNAVPMVVISAFIFVLILRQGKCIYKKEYWKYALVFSLPLIPHHLSGNLLNSFDRIMINKYAGPADTGLYSLAYSYSLFLSIVWSSMNRAWAPWFYGKMKEDNIADIRKYVKPYIAIFSIVYAIMLLVGPEALKFFGPEEYWESKWVVPPVLSGLFMQFIYSLYVNIEFYRKKTKYIAIGTLTAAVVNIVLNYLLIPVYGYIIAAYTTLVGFFILFIMHYFISKKWESRDLFDNKFVFIGTASIMAVTALAIFIYDSFLLRYGLLTGILLAIVLSYRRQIILLYRNIKGRKKGPEKFDNGNLL